MSGGFWEKVAGRWGRLDAESARAAVERLASAHGMLETVLRSLQEGVVVLDKGGKVVYANAGAGALLGADEGEMEGKPLGAWIPEVDWAGTVAAASGEEGGARREVELEGKGGRRRSVSVQVRRLEGGRGAGAGRAVAILRDVTGEMRHTAERVESERLDAILLLSAEVAHEIGNPLNSMGIHLQLLERELRKLPEGERENLGELVGVARAEAGRLGRVLSQFLKAIRATAPEFAKEDLPGIVRETLGALRAEIEDRRIWVEEEPPGEGFPAVWADRVQAGQACYNVVRNAVQAMPPGGVLRIRYGATERLAGVSFQDTGPGIGEGRIGALFGEERAEDGHGLGLMVVQRILRDHGGTVEIDTSRGGTRVQLNFRREDRRMGLLEAGGE